MANEILDNRGGGIAGWQLPAIHPEGRKFAVISGIVCLFFSLMAWETLAWPTAALTVGILAFFRDPKRVTPQGERLVIAPADGMVSEIVEVSAPPELADAAALGAGRFLRVSIFMSVFDVHINRAPIGGTVARVSYISGKFVNAELDKASEENERQHVLIEGDNGDRIGLTQIAGLVARRIVPFVKEGDYLAAGQRFGLIRFGSRVDVYLPEGTTPRVIKGQRTIAGETVLAALGEVPEIEGVLH